MVVSAGQVTVSSWLVLLEPAPSVLGNLLDPQWKSLDLLSKSQTIPKSFERRCEIFGGTSNNVLIVGAGTGNFGAAQSAGSSVEILGTNVKITDNPFYNEGFTKRRALQNNGSYYACCIPLKYYAPALRALGDGLANINFRFTFQKPYDAESLVSVNGIDAGRYMIADSGFELHIPTYTPDSTRMSEISAKLSKGITEVRKYVDLDIYQSSSQFAETSTTTNAIFVNAIEKRPIGCMIAFQYTGDYQSQTGNTHRYFCPNLNTIQVQLGSGQIFPKTQFSTISTGNTALTTRPPPFYIPGEPDINAGYTKDQSYYYREFLKFTNLLRSETGSCMIDYEMFLKHKFFACFDMRELDEQYFYINTPVSLTVNATHDAIPTNANVNTFLGGVAPNTLNYAPGGGYNVWLFLFSERSIEMTQNASGVSVRSNVDDST